MLQSMRGDYSYTHPPVSTTRNLFTQLSKLGHCRTSELVYLTNGTSRCDPSKQHGIGLISVVDYEFPLCNAAAYIANALAIGHFVTTRRILNDIWLNCVWFLSPGTTMSCRALEVTNTNRYKGIVTNNLVHRAINCAVTMAAKDINLSQFQFAGSGRQSSVAPRMAAADYVTVGHRTIVVKTTYAAHRRLAKTFIENAWDQLSAMIYSVDCYAIVGCRLDYTEPLPLLYKE